MHRCWRIRSWRAQLRGVLVRQDPARHRASASATAWRPPELTRELRKVHQFNTFSIAHALQQAIAALPGGEARLLARAAGILSGQARSAARGARRSRLSLPPAQGTYFQLLDFADCRAAGRSGICRAAADRGRCGDDSAVAVLRACRRPCRCCDCASPNRTRRSIEAARDHTPPAGRRADSAAGLAYEKDHPRQSSAGGRAARRQPRRWSRRSIRA